MFLFADSLKKQCSCHEETSAKVTEKKAIENKALLGKWMDQQERQVMDDTKCYHEASSVVFLYTNKEIFSWCIYM